MIKTILFDFDGTLVDSAPGIVKTMEQTFLRMGVTVPEESAIIATIGLPLDQALQMLGGLSDEDTKKATLIYRDIFTIYEVNYIKTFNHVVSTLNRLKELGIRMAIVTSRESTSLNIIVDSQGLTPFFETSVTGADGYKPKPAPDMVLALMQRMNLKGEETLVVGDTTFDIEMGNSAGCRTVAVTYGYHSKEKLSNVKPTFIINSFDELPNIVEDYGKN